MLIYLPKLIYLKELAKLSVIAREFSKNSQGYRSIWKFPCTSWWLNIRKRTWKVLSLIIYINKEMEYLFLNWVIILQIFSNHSVSGFTPWKPKSIHAAVTIKTVNTNQTNKLLVTLTNKRFQFIFNNVITYVVVFNFWVHYPFKESWFLYDSIWFLVCFTGHLTRSWQGTIYELYCGSRSLHCPWYLKLVSLHPEKPFITYYVIISVW